MMVRDAILAIAACGSIAAAAQGQAYVDAFGDATAAFGGSGPLLDIDTIDVSYDATNLYFLFTFHTPIVAPSAQQPNSVLGVLEFDVDQNTATGDPPLQSLYSSNFPNLSAGVDYVLLFSSELFDAGNMAVMSVELGDAVGVVPVTFGTNSLSGVIPLSMLGGDDGLLNFTALIGTLDQPTDATDVVGTSYQVPVPGAVMLLGAGLLTGRRRRRTA